MHASKLEIGQPKLQENFVTNSRKCKKEDLKDAPTIVIRQRNSVMTSTWNQQQKAGGFQEG